MSKSNRSSESIQPVRRSFTDEFKRDAVNLVVNQGYTLAEASRSLGLHPNSFVPAIPILTLEKVFSREAKGGIVFDSKHFRNWKQKFMPEINGQAVLSEDEKAELKRLREEVRKLRMERDILKKATVRHGRFDSLCEGFAKESQ